MPDSLVMNFSANSVMGYLNSSSGSNGSTAAIRIWVHNFPLTGPGACFTRC